MRIVAYTAVFGGYDRLQESKFPAVCVTDAPQEAGGWTYRRFGNSDNPRFWNRWCKLHPEQLFPDADATIYFDGNIQLLASPLQIVTSYLEDSPVAVFNHPEGRTCVYEECRAVVEKSKAKKRDVDITLQFLKNRKYPKDKGLAACYVLVRKNCNVVRLLDGIWWQLYQSLPAKRDQLTFNYACWILGIKYNIIPGNLFKGTSREFSRRKHVN